MKYNFNGFTTKANEALNQAIGSAEQLGHTYVGSEHLLLGLLKIGTGVAAAVLNKNGITAENIEELIRNRELRPYDTAETAYTGDGTIVRFADWWEENKDTNPNNIHDWYYPDMIIYH